VSDDGFRCGPQTDESRRLPRGRDGCWAAASHGCPEFRHTGAQARWQGHELKPAHHDGGRSWLLPITPSPLPASRFSTFCHTNNCVGGRAWKRLLVLAVGKKVSRFAFHSPPSGFPHNYLACQLSLSRSSRADHQRLRALLTNKVTVFRSRHHFLWKSESGQIEIWSKGRQTSDDAEN